MKLFFIPYFRRANIANTFGTSTGFADAERNVQVPGNKVALALNTNGLLLISRLRVKLEFKVLQERLQSNLYVLYFYAHDRFFESFNEKFKQMFEAGLFDQYIREVIELYIRNIPHGQLEEPFKVLTLEELEAGFVVSVAPLFLAIAIFCLEWIVKAKDFVVVICIFQAFFKTRQVETDEIFKSRGRKETFWKSLLATRAPSFKPTSS